MGSRFLCKSLQQLSATLFILSRTQTVSLRTRCPEIGGFSSYLVRTQPLHVKVYDKDAGLAAQRELNAKNQSEELLKELDKPQVQQQETFLRAEQSQKFEHYHKQQADSTSEIDENPDVFGGKQLKDEEVLDAGDVAEEEFTRNPTRHNKKLRTKEYAQLIKEHLNANRLKDAIEVLELRMLKEDRVKPENYIYNLLISGCAKAGYTRKAFSLFTRMRQRGLKVTGGTYTSLFNACANAPSAEDGHSRANHLREIMLEKGYEPNVLNYNAMIKAYGRCRDIKTAFLLVDEMIERQLEVNADTFNFLLQACASDRQYGFRHCLLTWHKMLQRGISPDYFSFNTVLRCVRDCGFGDLQTMEQVLKQILDERQSMSLKQPESEAQKQLDAPPTTQFKNSEISGENTQLSTQFPATGTALQVSTNSSDLEIPNLLAPRPHLGSMISITEVTRPHDRFLLLGGLTGFLELMKQRNITPGIECFTAMLEVIPPTNAAEKQLISFIRKIGLKSDIDFFNVLIKKRSMRFDYEGAKEVLSMIRTAGLHPDIVTYGVMALGCCNAEEARELMQQMKNNEVRLNIQILGAMLRQGCAQNSFSYIIEILQISLEANVRPNDIFLRHLHNFYRQCARAIDARHPSTKSKAFKKGHAHFCEKLRMWYEERGIAGLKLEDAIKHIKERPYQHYKEDTVDGLEPLKNVKQARAQKLRKYIKKIKLDSLKGDDESLRQETTKRIE